MYHTFFIVYFYRFAKMKKNKNKVKEDFRENLKSTGQSKFGLEEDEEVRN